MAANYCQSEKEARALAASHPGILAVQADVADRGQVDRMTKEVLHQFGHIDVLINNAGIAQQKLFTDVTETEWERLFSVNVTGVFHCCQAVLPGMIRRQRGKILNLSSIWGMTGASCEVAYSAAKGADIAFTKALAQEVGPSGIQVNCVAPGVIETEMNGNLSAETLGRPAGRNASGRAGQALRCGGSHRVSGFGRSRFYYGAGAGPQRRHGALTGWKGSTRHEIFSISAPLGSDFRVFFTGCSQEPLFTPLESSVPESSVSSQPPESPAPQESSLPESSEELPAADPYLGAAVPESEPLDESYFDDAVFVGDSLTYGLGAYQVLDAGKVIAHTGINPQTILTKSCIEQPGRLHPNRPGGSQGRRAS